MNRFLWEQFTSVFRFFEANKKTAKLRKRFEINDIFQLNKKGGQSDNNQVIKNF